MGKRALLINILADIRASYWFLPSVLAVLAVLLAQITVYLDHNKILLSDAWRTTQVEGARATLAVIAQSVIGVTGVMFSMTIVAVSFASGNFGPRLIGNFMRDRGNQWSLGILIATFVYALLILRSVQSQYGGEGAHDAFVPHLSILVSLVLTGISVLTLIFYVHHIPELINVSNISASLGNKLRSAIRSLIDAGADSTEEADFPFPHRSPDHQICISDQGYLQTWDKDTLVGLMHRHNACAQVLVPVGSFVSRYSVIVHVWSDKEIDDAVLECVRECFALGNSPTEQQNLTFVIDQLVEMIARALSPGVNDPYTAINCLNWLYDGLVTAANHNGGVKTRGQGRVMHASLDFETLLARSFEAPLPYISTDILVTTHLKALLKKLKDEVRDHDMSVAVVKLEEKVDALTSDGATENQKYT